MLSPLPDSQWNFEKAAHLLNRAGFGGTPAQIQKLVALGPEKAVAHFVDFESIPDSTSPPEWAKPDPERFKRARDYRSGTEQQRREMRRMEQQTQRERILELRQWWLQRMAHGPRPLQEKLTLFWHGHFATSAQKVKDSYLMYSQNETFRKNAAGSWLAMLTDVSKDPAMLLWLDQAQSKKQHPNENYARELMELFTLGEGNYTEKDVTEAARALTGWSYDRASQQFQFRRNIHDEGQKTILGKTGNFGGEDLLKIILGHPQSARFIARKLWVFFASEDPSDDLVNALAARFRSADNNFRPLLRALFRSEEFYSGNVMRQQVKSPVQWLVSSIRMLERDLPPQQVSSAALRTLGQELFLPPNVKGWDGGIAWITTNNLLNRYNFSSYLVLGENPAAILARKPGKPARGKRMRQLARGSAVKVDSLIPSEAQNAKDKLIGELQRRFVQSKFTAKTEQTLRDYLDSQGELDQEDILQSIRLVMSTPEFQLC